MSDEILQQLLTETLRQGQVLGGLKTDMENLVGNGKPGRIAIIEADVSDLQATKNKILGINAAIAFVVGCWEWVKWHWHLSS